MVGLGRGGKSGRKGGDEEEHGKAGNDTWRERRNLKKREEREILRGGGEKWEKVRIGKVKEGKEEKMQGNVKECIWQEFDL